jgi:hypothetical protein
MSAVRFLVLAALATAALNACSSYKQVDDPSDGSNAKTKLHPSAAAR